ncbi:MAG: hypothetical protein K0R25_1248 [Rickettsiaceae bacterium]|jgi:saccharopine dehydrogenase-like NADP-dependent oxidoreductase|nr:hypothetical protein [Rickettsiaceae bacterium]
MKKILILGGYGNFGNRIATALAKANIAIIIAGRDQNKAKKLAQNLTRIYPNSHIEIAIFDVKKELAEQLKKLNPTLVINTAGPFQNSDYNIAEICIGYAIHYIDLADGRDFVCGISKLDEKAKQAQTLVISGASTVPCLSSAVLEKYKNEFSEIDSLVFGISPGQKSHRGLATTKAILTYVGKSIKPCAGSNETKYGWQDLYRIEYPALGKRWMANCDIPDLDLLPQRYNIKSISFVAGMESGLLHLGIWLFSWLVRIGLPINLPKHAEFLLKISHYFDYLGSANGGMHVIIKGQDKNQKAKTVKWFIIAKNGDGPQIPTIPAIILAKKILSNQIEERGAMPCLAMITLDEYMDELKEFEVKQYCFMD